ncbi:glutamate racemase, partial [Streptomyces sp. SID6041]|nr:glutamate racemase [Streptomyces sp. SID6041]
EDRILAALLARGRSGLPPLVFHGSADAVAAQALRRAGALPAPDADPTGGLSVLLSGRPGRLPATALGYAEGRLLAAAAAAH